MTPRKRLMGAGAAVLAASLVLSACGGGTGDGEGGDTLITVGNGEPQNPLIPSMTNESFGGMVIDTLFSGLMGYDESGAVHEEVAESIETEDNQTWTVTLKDGWTFSDGTPVTSDSFIDAWNWSAYGPNGANLSYFFTPIEGFEDVQFTADQLKKDGSPKDGEKPKSETMSGLKAVSDTEFTIKLSQPEADFPIRLGYAAFYPLPESFFEDTDAYGEKPIGNGPYVLTEWEHDTAITVKPNEEYSGENAAQNDGVEFIVYTDEDSQYNDLLDNALDIVPNVPASSFATFEDELGDRAVNKPSALTQVVNVPEYVEDFQGEAGLLRRQAISMAIDREAITSTVYNDARTPASDFTNPVVVGWSEDVPGNEVLEYQPDEAKKLWDKAEKMDPVGKDFTLLIASNADSDHQSWIDPACNTIRKALGIECEFDQYPIFDEFLNARDDDKIKGLFRGGWQADYPAAGNFLGPIYGTGAGSNDMNYSNKKFDAKLKEAAGAETVEESNEILTEAQSILFEELPGIPLWYYNVTAGYSENVDNVVFGWDSEPILTQVTKSE